MKVGYARTSTLDQTAGFEAQIRDLTATGCNRVYQEQVSSVAQRDQLAAALDFIREGDTLAVTKLDRLARSTQHLLEIAAKVKAKGARFHNHARRARLRVEANTAFLAELRAEFLAELRVAREGELCQRNTDTTT